MISKEQIWEDIKPQVKEIAKIVAEKVLMASIDQLIADSPNKYDDGFWAMVKPAAQAELDKQLGKI